MTTEKQGERTLFCSYARVDRSQVEPIANQLRQSDFDIWIDVDDIPPAAEWMREVEEAIDASLAFVLFLSPAYVSSEVCRREAQRAREDGKRIVPVLIETCAALDELKWVADLNWIVATSGTHDEGVVAGIVGAVSTNPNWQDTHRRLLLRAREWEASGRSKSRVLRGGDITAAQDALAASRLPGDAQPVDIQREFITASMNVRQRQRRLIATLAAIVTATSLALGATAIVQRNSAQTERSRAEDALIESEQLRESAQVERDRAEDALTVSERLQAEAEARVLASASEDEPDPVWSSLFAIEALYRTPTPLPEALEAWLAASRRYGELPLFPLSSTRLPDGTRVISVAPTGDAALVKGAAGQSAEIVNVDGSVLVGDLPLDAPALWSPDGELIAHSDDETLFITDRRGVTVPVDGVAEQTPRSWSPNGQFLVTVGEGSMWIVEITDGEPNALGWIPTGFTTPRLAWSANGRYLSISSTELLGDFPDPYTQIVDVVDGIIGGQIFGREVSPNGRVGFVRSPAGWQALLGSDQGAVQAVSESEFLADYPQVTTASTYSLPSVAITVVAASRTGNTVAIGGADGSLHVDGTTVISGDGAGPISRISWDPTGSLLVASTDAGRLVVADRDGRLLGDLPGRNPAEAPVGIEWSTRGDRITIGWPDGDIEQLEVRLMADLGASANVGAGTTVAWSPSGDLLAVGDSDGGVTVLRDDGTPSDAVYASSDTGVYSGSPVWDLAWSPDGAHIAVEFENGGFAMLSATTAKVVGAMEMRWTGPLGISWSPDSSVVATRNADMLPAFLTTAGEWLETINGAEFDADSLSEVVFTDDGAIAVMDYDGRISVLPPDAEPVVIESAPYASLVGGSTSPLLVDTDDGVRMLASSGALSDPLTSERVWNARPVWSPDRTRLVLLDGDRELAVFAPGGEELGRLTIPTRRELTRVSWGDPDDNGVLVVGDSDGALWLADMNNGPSTIRLGVNGVDDFVASPLGDRLATVAVDGTVSIRTQVQPAELCPQLLELVAEDAFVEALARLTPTRSCASNADLATIELAPVAQLMTTRYAGSADASDQQPSVDDISMIQAFHDDDSVILAPVAVDDRTFAFSSSSRTPMENDFTVWEFTSTGWQQSPDVLADGPYYPNLFGLRTIDVDDDGADEVLVQFSPNGPVGVVLRFESGAWETIGSGENLEYVPGEGLSGVGNDCDPSCAEGSAVYFTMEWDGTRLVSRVND